jgi:hypothetical protein
MAKTTYEWKINHFKSVLSERLNELELAPLKNQELPW